MSKSKQYIILSIATSILVGIIVTLLLLPSIQKSSSKYDNTALPQLSNLVAKNESEVKISTTVGDITIKLFNKYAPLAVENFISHAKNGYYNKTIFHRVIADFMIQGGDPTGTGSGGHSIWYNKDKTIDSGNGFKNEVSSSLYNIRGSLAMANSGANTNGSQFFINQNKQDQSSSIDSSKYPQKIINAYKKGGNPSLDGDYTVFGQVIHGMSIVDKIATAAVKSSGEGSTPVNPVSIKSITIIKEAK